MDGSRRRFLKIGVGVGVVIAGYLLWREFYTPEIHEAGEKPQPSPQPGNQPSGGEESKPPELNIEFTEYPRNSPLGYNSPYLVIEPISGSQNDDTVFITLNCQNRGSAPSTAVLEVFRIDGDFTLPLNLSSLPKIYNNVIHLSPGSSTPLSLSFTVPTSFTGLLFLLSDPVLDSCPRSYNSSDELNRYYRHFIYFGK